MDPKQQRVLRDGTASEADQPRAIDRESVREQAENPPVPERPRQRRRTAAVADIRVNQPSGTIGGGDRIPELGESDRPGRNGGDEGETTTEQPRRDEPAKKTRNGEARRTLAARREHSKGDGNFPEPEKAPTNERREARAPREVPKARDDRSAPKGNATAGQRDRNRKPQKTKPRKSGAASKTKRPNAQLRAAAKRGSRKPATKRATRKAGPRARSGATRGGKR